MLFRSVKLVLLDSGKMEIIAESQETVAENSVLVQDSSYLFCIISEGKKFYAAKYDKELHLLAKSAEAVKSSSPITVSENQICVTNVKGKIMLLSKNDLSQVGK